MNPLSLLYGIAMKLRNAAYDRGWRHTHRLVKPVISVGNLSAGGTGKTPFVILLGELLQRRGISFDVLSRGYGRRSRGTRVVEINGAASDYGDEPLLIARRLSVPVVVSESRFAAGQVAESRFNVQMHLLDDGFQHRGLARDFDIVMLGVGDREDALLPAGRLREPHSSLRRADAIVVEEPADLTPVADEERLWRITRGVEFAGPLDGALAFCGIARPTRFFDQLRAGGARLTGTRAFPDHHSYSASDITLLLKMKTETQATCFVTTEKDEINLGQFRTQLAPLVVARAMMNLHEAERLLSDMLTMVAERVGVHERIWSQNTRNE